MRKVTFLRDGVKGTLITNAIPSIIEDYFIEVMKKKSNPKVKDFLIELGMSHQVYVKMVCPLDAELGDLLIIEDLI